MNNTAYLSLGSNMGDREQFLQEAVRELRETKGVQVERVSSIYETDPVGFEEQAQFLNIALELKTNISPLELLNRCLEIEEELGRKRELRWGPRVIDLDVLLFNEDVIETERLQVPHPRMNERAFVLVPLVEIAPSLCNPLTGEELLFTLNGLEDKDGVRMWKHINNVEGFLI